MQERLQKLIAEAGLASRRKAEQMILEGRVQVNNQTVQELGTKADPAVDNIKVDGKSINAKITGRSLVYLLLNKPRGYLSSNSDPEKRPLAVDLIPREFQGKVHSVGRLDFNTEGLLLLTNDGALTDYVTRAGHVAKVYLVKVKGHPGQVQVERLRRGVAIDERRTKPAEVELLESTDADNSWFRVILREGRNQQIRKMFDAIGHSVVKLRRVQIGPITNKGLNAGAFRHLTAAEVKRLMTPDPNWRAAHIMPMVRASGGDRRGPTGDRRGPSSDRRGPDPRAADPRASARPTHSKATPTRGARPESATRTAPRSASRPQTGARRDTPKRGR